jgi:MFS family permease
MIYKSNPFKIFYGWWIVIASFLVALYTGGVIYYGFTAFFEPIAKEMGWSYMQISLAASLRGLEAGLLAPLVGILADRLGPRKVLFGGILITAVGLFLLSSASSLFTFYVAFALLAIGLSACSVAVLLTALANWFHRKIGLATGIASGGYGFSGILIPVVVGLIAVYGWRVTLNICALGMIVMILPLSLLFRHRPEQYGYSLDGQEHGTTIYPNYSGSLPTAEVEVRAKQALKSGIFWRLTLSRMYHLMTIAAITTHVMPYLSSIGISRSTSSLVATGIPLMSIIGRFGFGWLGDKFNRRLMATTNFLLIGCGTLCFAYAYASDIGTLLIIAFLFLLGIGYGGTNSLLPSLGREYFGRTNFGSIYGLMEGIGAIGSIIGPALAGWAYDNSGSYHIIWLLLAGFAIVPTYLVFTIAPVSNLTEPDDKAQL